MDKWLEQFARTNFRRSGDTAHDLKTPLNVSVLNLELLRMRLAKLGAGDDEKIAGYAAAIEGELRRLGRIFDAFFLLSTPPKEEGEPGEVNLGALANEFERSLAAPPAVIRAHESRMRDALKMFFDGASRLFAPNTRTASAAIRDDRYEIAIAGAPADESVDLSKVFKLYYTDADGRPDLSLASARLIAETYGGELSAIEEPGRVVLRLSFPLGDS